MKKLFIETYGCQMNVADSEVVASVMQVMNEALDAAMARAAALGKPDDKYLVQAYWREECYLREIDIDFAAEPPADGSTDLSKVAALLDRQ